MPASPKDSPAPPLLAQGINRRSLLKAAGLLGLAAWGGVWVFRTLRRFGPPAPGRVCLDKNEFAICEKIAEAFFPGPPSSPLLAREVQLAEFVDWYIGGLYDDQVHLFRILFRALNLSTVLGHGRSFYWLPLARRQQVLAEWSSSALPARRAGYQSLRFVFAMGYLEKPQVRAALGLRFGCPVDEREEPPDEAR